MKKKCSSRRRSPLLTRSSLAGTMIAEILLVLLHSTKNLCLWHSSGSSSSTLLGMASNNQDVGVAADDDFNDDDADAFQSYYHG